MLTYGERALISLSIRKILENHRLTLVVLCRRHLFIPTVEVLIDTEQLSDGGFVTRLVHIYLIDLLHDVDIEVIDGSLRPRRGCREGTLDHLRLLHVLLSDLIEADNLLLHDVEFSLQHFHVLLRLLIVLLD
jgi:hypothetical protein